MTESLQIFMEYKVLPQKIKEYEQAMKNILELLPEYEASDIEWYVAADQGALYVEMFTLPTKSHYHVLKKLRQSDEHPVFGQIAPCIDGGSEKIHCWAFYKKSK
ncbi:hypothetical protein [Alkalihalobacterium bogoriense]|uniref:hypothetical protein n=1 Tax=Alkalihalobacterium bogoriense TaxID=246272 RepID=UPI00047D4448|nr:hypothetical protein [Alkalihalobacterium bogoriense]